MDELHEEIDEGGVSRRDALKKMAVTAAGFWAVPVISSFRSPAFAQVTSPPCTFTGDCPQTSCGPDCGCLHTEDGENFCHQGSPCAGRTACTSDADCVAAGLTGYACANSCCGVPLCLPPCGTFVAGAGARVAGEAWSTSA